MGWQFVARPLPFVRRRRKSCCKSENLATLLTHSMKRRCSGIWKSKVIDNDWMPLNDSVWQCRRIQCPALQISSLFLLNLRVPLLHWRPEWPIENEDSHWGRTMSIGQFHLGKLAPACSRRIGLDGASFLFADAVNAPRPEMKLGSCLNMGLTL